MDEIIFTLKEIVRELNPDVLFVPKYGGELIELIPNNEKSRIGGIFTYSEHVTLEFSQGFRMDLGPGFLEGNGKYRRHIKFRTFVLFKEKDLEISGNSLSSYEDTTTDHGRPMINQFCRNCGTQIGINVPNMDTRHISIGTLDQRRDIEIKDNIWWQEALEFVSFPSGSDVYKTGYWNGTGEKITK